ncbi:MAG: glycosyl transferase family 2 [Magnetococcales bacterium]|nr:glycosyl transferase family 2 [Magnetococcales bacterium]
MISVIIPAFNEAENIKFLFERCVAVLQSLQRPYEIILVDDGSTDDTFKTAVALSERFSHVTVLRHNKNHGKSLALMQGFDIAQGEICITLDADLQDEPEMIPLFLDKIEEGYDLVNGWRVDRQDTYPKKMVSRWFNYLTQRFFDCPLHDINCGFKAIRRSLYKKLYLRGDLHRLVPILAFNMGHPISEVPIRHQARLYGKSKYALLRHRGLLDLIALASVQATKTRPFHVFCEVAAVFAAVAFVLFTIWVITGSFLSSVRYWRLIPIVLHLSMIWFVFVATLLPIFGLVLEIIISNQLQTRNWRNELCNQRVSSPPQPDELPKPDPL